ncbi:MAG: hypothetical protein WCP86_08615 [bacterium]
MKTSALMDEDVLVRKAVRALIADLGTVETQRFLTLPGGKRDESVARHHKWQRRLKKDPFFDQVFH